MVVHPLTTSESVVPSRRALAAAVLSLPLLLTACSSGGNVSPTASPTNASPTSASPTDSPAPSPTDSPTESPTQSPTSSPSPSGSPSTVSPSPAVGVDGITVVYAPTTAALMQPVSITGTTNAALAGKPVYIVKLNDGAPRVISTGSIINAQGIAKTYAQLGRTGVLQLIVPAQQLTGTPDSLGSFPLDPSATILARSGDFTVTFG